MNISGAALSAVAANIFATVYACREIKRKFGLSVSPLGTAVPSLIAGSACAVAAYLCYNGLVLEFSSAVSVLGAAAVGGVVYFFLLFLADSRELTAVLKSFSGKKQKNYCKKQ